VFLNYSRHKLSFLIFSCILFSGYSLADTTLSGANSSTGKQLLIDTEKRQGWSGAASIGLSLSTGNTEKKDLTISGHITHNELRLKHTIAVKGELTEKRGNQTENMYKLAYKVDYALSNQGYLFNVLAYKYDKFANIDYRVFNVVGYGRQVIKNNRHDLQVKAGVGLLKVKYLDEAPNNIRAPIQSVKTPDVKGGIIYLGMLYKFRLTDTTTFSEEITLQGADEANFSESVTSLNIPITKKVSVSLNYTASYEPEVTGRFKKTNTKTSVNLVGKF
jgi:putative salt-induced outer membrane protein